MDNITKIQMFNKIGGIFSFIGMSLSTFDGDLQNGLGYLIFLLIFYYTHIKIKENNEHK